MKPLSLVQYRASIAIIGEKSALFAYKKEIFEALDMRLSHAQIHNFLTTQKGLNISVRAVSKWIKTHKKTKSKYTAEPRVEPKEASIPEPIDDDFYNRLRKVADKRAKWLGTNPHIPQETQNENSSM